MKRIKLLTAIALIASMCSSYNIVFAQGNTLDINSAIDLALKNSYSFKMQNYSVQKTQDNYDSSRDAATKADEALTKNDDMIELINKPNKTLEEQQAVANYIPLTDDQKYGFIKTRDIKPLEAKCQLLVVQNNKEVIENTIKTNIYTQYSSVMNIKDNIDFEQKKIINLENIYKNTQLKMKLGLIPKIDTRKNEINYINEKSTLTKIQRQMDIAQMSLNQILGESLSERYDSFPKDFFRDTVKTKTLDQYLASALKNRAEIVNAEQYLKMKQASYSIANREFPDKGNKNNQQAKYDEDEAENNLSIAKLNIQQQVIQDYNDLAKKVKKVESVKKSFDTVKKSYNEADQRYKLGMISKIDLESKELTFKQAENNLKSLERDLWTSQLKLDYECGKGVNANSSIGAQ